MTPTLATPPLALDPAPSHVPARVIDDPHHLAVRRVADVLRHRSARPRLFVLDDPGNITQAVACGVRVDSVYLTASAATRGLPALPGVGPDVPRHVLADATARTLFGGDKTARVFALAHAPRSARLDDLVGVPGDVVVLDGVRLVGNIGAITRTASALGAAGVVLVDSGLDSVLDRRLTRASRGLSFALPLVLTDRETCAEFLRRERLTVAALAADGAAPLTALGDVAERVALVLGSERHGVSAALDALATARFGIAMTPHVESLNVSVAAGIALYEHRRGAQRPA